MLNTGSQRTAALPLGNCVGWRGVELRVGLLPEGRACALSSSFGGSRLAPSKRRCRVRLTSPHQGAPHTCTWCDSLRGYRQIREGSTFSRGGEPRRNRGALTNCWTSWPSGHARNGNHSAKRGSVPPPNVGRDISRSPAVGWSSEFTCGLWQMKWNKLESSCSA